MKGNVRETPEKRENFQAINIPSTLPWKIWENNSLLILSRLFSGDKLFCKLHCFDDIKVFHVAINWQSCKSCLINITWCKDKLRSKFTVRGELTLCHLLCWDKCWKQMNSNLTLMLCKCIIWLTYQIYHKKHRTMRNRNWN